MGGGGKKSLPPLGAWGTVSRKGTWGMEIGVLEVWGFWGLVWGWGGLSGDWKSRPSRGASGVEGGSVVTGAGDEVGASWGAGDELFSGKSLPSLGGSAGVGTPYFLGGGGGGGAYFGGGGP